MNINNDTFQSKIRESGKTKYESIFCGIWVMVVLYMIMQPTTHNSSLIRMIWIPSTLVLFVISVSRRMAIGFFFELIVPLSIIFFSFVSQSGALNQEHILAAFCYINMFFVVYKCKEITPQKSTFDFIFYCSVFLSLLFALYSVTPIAHRVHTHGIVWMSSYYVFDLDNSNIAAMYIFAFYSILLINLGYRKHKALIVLLMMYDFYMIYGTRCRSVMITMIIITILFFALGRRKIPQFVVVIGVLSPAVFALFYMWLYGRIGNQAIMIFDKSLFSGRQNNYLEYLSYLDGWGKVLFGNFSKAGFQNAHNIVVAVLASSGVVGLLAFLSFYIRMMTGLNKEKNSAIRNICIVCILGLFIQSSMEASLFLGGFPGIMIITSFALLSNYTDYDLRLKEE